MTTYRNLRESYIGETSDLSKPVQEYPPEYITWKLNRKKLREHAKKKVIEGIDKSVRMLKKKEESKIKHEIKRSIFLSLK